MRSRPWCLLGIHPHGLPLAIGYFTVSLTFGIFMSRLIEYPALLVRDRLFPSRTVTTA